MKRNTALSRALILAAAFVGSATPALAQPTALDPTLTQIVTGGAHSCAVTTTGGVKCWGSNFGGALGDGTTTQRNAPVTVAGLSGVASLALGNAHSCALNTSGGVKCWGWNVDGQLGDGTNVDRLTPASVPGLTYGVASLVARGNHTCALTTLGAVKCWGANGSGQLGDGGTVARSSPTGVPDLTTDVVGISAGQEHTCALTRAYGVKCWGNNVYGQLGDGTTANRLAPVNVVGMTAGVASLAAGGYHTCALTAQGGAVCWGYNGYGQVGDGNTAAAQPSAVTVSGLGNGVVALSASSTSTCAVTDAGPAKCWGGNDYGQLGDGTTTNRVTPTEVIGLTGAVADLSANDSHVCARTPNEGAKCWGYNGYGQIGNGTTAAAQTTPALVTGLAVGVVRVSAGSGSTCALTPTGGVKCWGDNSNGQLGDLTFTSRSDARDVTGLTSGVQSVSAGAYHACVLTAVGGVKCWGMNQYGQLGDGTTTARTSPVDVAGLTTGVVSVAAGWFQTCALTTAGGMKCWGRNASGALGDGTFIDRSTPVDVVGLTSGVVSAYSSGLTSCAITSSGGAKCWGYNGLGGLGDGTTTNRSTPVGVSGLSSGVSSMAMGQYHSCAVLSSGGLKCWGRDNEGQVGDGTTTLQRLTPVSVVGMGSGVAAVTVGNLNTCAVTTAGAAKCWGGGGRLGDGVTDQSSTPIDVLGLSSGVASISAGGAQTCAVLTDGGLRCWGGNNSGQVGDWSTTARSSPVKIRAVQNISFEPPPYFALGSTYPLSATSSSGLSVGFETLTLDTCPVLGTNVTASFLALCGLRANQGGDGNNAPASQVSRLVLEASGYVPDPPTMGGAQAGDGSATVQFAVPGFDGFNPITSYTAKCGDASQVGYGSPIVVGGLVNGVAVTCTVLATNIVGDSAPSSPSNSVTPASTANVSLTLNLDGAAGGYGDVTAGSSQCDNASGPRTCVFSYPPGTVVQLVAHPSTNSVFEGWTGACAAQGTNPTCEVAMSGAATVGASFLGPHILTVNLTSVENGLGTVSGSTSGGASLQCDAVPGAVATCSMLVREGDTVLLGAIPGALSILTSITGCGAGPIDPNGSGCPPFTMSGAQSIDVSLRGPQTLTLQGTSLENGVGTIHAFAGSVAALQCDAVAGTTTTCTLPVRVGDVMWLSMAPGTLSIATSVVGCDAEPLYPEGPACAPFTMTGPRTVSATFRGPQTLTVRSVSLENGIGAVYGSGSSTGMIQCDAVAGVTSTCITQVRVGDSISLSAIPGALSILSLATGCEMQPFNPNGSSCTPFTITGPTTVDVTFRGPRTLTLSVQSLAGGVGVLEAAATPFESGALSTCWGAAGTTVTCTGQFKHGSTIQITTGGSGTDWVQDLIGCTWDPATEYPSCTIDLSADRTVTASFLTPQTLSVHVASVESGYGAMIIATEFAGVRTNLPYCPAVDNTIETCSVEVHARETVFLTGSEGASPSVIESLSGCVVAPIVDPDRSCVPFTMTGPVAVTLTLRGPQNLNVSLSGDGSGTVAWAGGPLPACQSGQGPCVYPARIGTPQGLSATPALDSLFQAWTGACAGQGAVCTVTLTDDVSTEAVFVLRNHPPAANVGGPYSGVRNTAIVFSGAASSDPDSDPLTYSWDFGDGSAVGTGAAPTHAYSTTGTFTVTLTVNDGNAISAPATSTVTISNQTPSASAGGPYSGVRNAAISFSSSGSNDPDSDPLTYSWDFGDGSAAGMGAAPTHAYSTTGTFTVTLTVNDGTASSAPATATVTISNQAPSASAGGPYSGVRNTAITFSGAGSNDPDNDSLTYSWDFGDGSAAGTGVAPTHAYTTTGTFTVTLTVNDGTTDSTPATSTVTISNRAPVASPGGPYSGTRLAAIAFSGTGSSDPDGDALTYAWAFGDGSTGTGAAPTHLYTAVGTFTVTLTVNDGTVSSAPVTTTVQITNVAATVSITAPAGGAVFHAPASVLVSAAAADLDGSVARVEFFAGGGKIGEAFGAPYSVMWAGASPGVYALSAVVTDSSGATATSAPVSVLLNAPPTVALTAPADNAQFAAPASITLTASASDSDGVIAQVEFFRGSSSLGIDSTSPYSLTWSGAATGVYTLTAVATDDRGAVVASAPVTVKVTATLTPTADAYVRASNGNSNFGAAATVTVQQGSSNSNRRWTYMKFDLSSVPTITSAKVRVFGAVSATTSTTIQTAAYPVSNTTWTETGLTWNNKPATGTTALATVAIVNNSTTARWYELDVTAYLQAEKAAGRNVVTLALKNLANSSPYVSFTSKEGVAANRPQVLVVP